jgi:8-oxo-dGTP diphosphatase
MDLDSLKETNKLLNYCMLYTNMADVKGILDRFPKPHVTVDIIVFTIKNNDLKVVLVKRGREPFKDQWAVPGGFVRMRESVEEAAKRELEEETGIEDVYLEQLYTFGDVKRDPRARVITVAYFALVDPTKIKLELKPSRESLRSVEWHSMYKLPKLAFDHKKILDYALQRLRYKLEYSPVGFELLPQLFTLADLKKVYEVILDQNLDKRNFIKKIKSMDFLEESEEFRSGPHRPARLYKFKKRKKEETKFKKVKFEK